MSALEPDQDADCHSGELAASVQPGVAFRGGEEVCRERLARTISEGECVL